jgi:hypothetical protein
MSDERFKINMSDERLNQLKKMFTPSSSPLRHSLSIDELPNPKKPKIDNDPYVDALKEIFDGTNLDDVIVKYSFKCKEWTRNLYGLERVALAYANVNEKKKQEEKFTQLTNVAEMYCLVCGNFTAECVCCHFCNLKPENCLCCKLCNAKQGDCFCCVYCGGDKRKCNCCEICGLDRNDCGCSPCYNSPPDTNQYD